MIANCRFSFLGKIALLLALTFSGASCAIKIHPPSVEQGTFNVGEDWMQIKVAPFENAMPGVQDDNIIIPIVFHSGTKSPEEGWERKLKLTKIRMDGVSPKYTSTKYLDHNSWMHNTLEEWDKNVLRVPSAHAPNTFNITIWFKDSARDKYKARFYRAYAGKVQ